MTKIEKTETPPVTISVQVGDEVHVRNLSEDLKVDEGHVNDYLIRAPGLTAYYNMLFEKQKSIVQRLKVKVERKFSELDTKFRKQYRDDDQKPVNAEIIAKINQDDEYKNLQEELLTNQENLNLLKAAVESIREMRSTLISLSANMRSERTIGVKKDKESEYVRRFR